MKDQKLTPVRFIYLAFLSFFGTGFAPKAPGTFGSLATIPLLLLFKYLELSFLSVSIITCALFVIACFVADYAQKKEEVHDPGWIVMDEVIGMLITWLFVFPATDFYSLAAIFITFRFFDIVKIFPANWCDQKIINGAGTIIDDVVSAIYAGLVLKLLLFFNLLT
ncbi:MAG: phosphatidylglycerophosphatase A [Halobacteriovoraceae bacterium]|jgi:phosphatidylglycerophosphatase A|nr:phosphatidylglycerophosphatase A [Halobacteriovoraceae bacterium]